MREVRDLPERVDVAVVGAGLAGLSAASLLAAGGASVVVLEARDRVGGRTWTLPVGSARFDLGAQWIGPGQERLAALARRLGVETFPTWASGDKLLDDGAAVARYPGVIPALRPLELAELHLALRRIDRMTRRVSARDPASSLDAARLDALTVADPARRIRSGRVRALFATAIGSIFGVEPAEMSLLWFLAYLRAGGGLMRLARVEGGAQERRFVGGAQGLAEKLADELGVVATGAAVRRIRQSGGGGDPAGEVVVTSDRGQVAARRAIVAVPPPLAARIELEPAAPAARDQLLQRHAMGALVKLVVAYEQPFWRQRGLSGEAVAIAGGPVAVTFDNTSHDQRQPALVAFIQGRAARQWDGDLAPVLEQLARWFGDQARRPVAVARCDWAAEPWSRGCPVAVVAAGGLTSTGTSLRQPSGRIHVAGTESAVEWTGYLEGALESGERAAREVLRAL